MTIEAPTTSMRPGPSRHPKVSPQSQHRFGFRSPPRLKLATSGSRPLPPDAVRVATGPGRQTSRQLKRGGVYPCCEVFQRRTEDEGGGRNESATRIEKTRGQDKKLEGKTRKAQGQRGGRRGETFFFCLGVARVHLIYQTLRNAEGTTPKLNHYPSEAPALRRALRPHVASRDAPALRPYELRRSCASTLRVATRPYDVATFPYDVATYGGS